MADMTYEEYLEYLDGLEREAGGGVGIVCKATFSPGYKAFASGFRGPEQAETWFPFEYGEAGTKEQALSKCKVFIQECGGGLTAQLCYGFVLRLNSVKAREVGWNGDRYFAYPLWQDAAKKIIKPALADLRIFPGDFWARWAWTDDPSGFMELDREGNERVRQIAYPAERYGSEEEAEAAARGIAENFEGSGGGVKSTPPPWLVEEARSLFKMAEVGAPASVLAGRLGVDAEKAREFIEGDKAVRIKIMAGAFDQAESLVNAALGS